MTTRRPVAWVTGGNGTLGRYVGRALRANGWIPVSISRGPWPEAGSWGFELHVDASVTAETLKAVAARKGSPKVVFHAAGTGTVGASYASPRQAFEDTVVTAQNTLEFVRRHAPAAPFVYPSSAAVYGHVAEDAQPISEDTPPSPTSPYGSHKLAVEELCASASRDFGLTCRLIRFFSLYGPHMCKQVVWDIASKAIHGEGDMKLMGTGGESRDFLHLEDAAALVSLVVADAIGGDPGCAVLNGGSGRATSIEHLANLILDGLPVEPGVTFSGITRAGDPRHYQADVARATAMGFAPSWRLEDGIGDFCRWFLRIPDKRPATPDLR